MKHERDPRRRVHAVGAGAVLCAWLLVRLGAVDTASIFLGRDPGLSGAVVRRIASSFTGGWIVDERKLAASLGTGFHSEEPTLDQWVRTLADQT